MATVITEECINCGACEPECPNSAISQGDDIYIINADLCTECVGFHGEEACAAVCPVDCCVPDPARTETEEQNYGKLARIHPDKQFPALAELPANLSRFRKAG
jgi:ferredoxin